MLSCAHGDRQAFALLYERYAPKCAGFVRSLLKDPDEAADITQDIFVRRWVYGSGLLRIISSETSLMQMVQNTVCER